MICRILLGYSQTPFVEINLAEEARKRFDMTSGIITPMIELKNQSILLEQIYRDKSLPCFGGYLEDRSELWRGFEDSKKMIHLGIDINNLLPGTAVLTPVKAIVIHVYKDNFENNGWGGRIIMKLETPYMGCQYLMYGHLAHANLPSVGSIFEADDVVAYIGDYKENGGWFCHLHVQLISDYHFNLYNDNLDKLDGYLLDSDFPLLNEYSVDPTGLVFN